MHTKNNKSRFDSTFKIVIWAMYWLDVYVNCQNWIYFSLCAWKYRHLNPYDYEVCATKKGLILFVTNTGRFNIRVCKNLFIPNMKLPDYEAMHIFWKVMPSYSKTWFDQITFSLYLDFITNMMNLFLHVTIHHPFVNLSTWSVLISVHTGIYEPKGISWSLHLYGSHVRH